MLKPAVASVAIAVIVLSILYPNWISDAKTLWSNRELVSSLAGESASASGPASQGPVKGPSSGGSDESTTFAEPNLSDADAYDANGQADFNDGVLPQPQNVQFIAAQGESVTLRVNGELAVFQSDEQPTDETRIAFILEDAVVLDYRGSLVLLDKRTAFFGYDRTLSPSSRLFPNKPQAATVIDYRRDAEASQAIARTRNNALANPLFLMVMFSVRPLERAGQLAGFEVAPGRDRHLFDTLQLEPGDQLFAVNGYRISNRAELPNLLTQARNAERLSATILRDGEPTLLVYDLSAVYQ